MHDNSGIDGYDVPVAMKSHERGRQGFDEGKETPDACRARLKLVNSDGKRIKANDNVELAMAA